MSILKQNTTDLETLLSMVNHLPYANLNVETCNVTITAATGIILQMYCSTTFTDSGFAAASDSNMLPRPENFATPVTINNVIVGSCVNFMFTGAILDSVQVSGDATVTKLGTGHYAIVPTGDCTVNCYDED